VENGEKRANLRIAIDDLQKKKINSVGVEVSFIQQEEINSNEDHLAELVP